MNKADFKRTMKNVRKHRNIQACFNQCKKELFDVRTR